MAGHSTTEWQATAPRPRKFTGKFTKLGKMETQSPESPESDDPSTTEGDNVETQPVDTACGASTFYIMANTIMKHILSEVIMNASFPGWMTLQT